MKCHEVDYEIFGNDMQTVEVELNQGLVGKLFSAGKRSITGESMFITHFTNQARDKKLF